MGEPVAGGGNGPAEWTAEALLEAMRTPDRDPVPLLCAALREGPAPVREEAARYLQRVRSPHAVTALADAVTADLEEAVRWEAAEALGVIGDPRAVPALVTATGDENELVRLCAAEALGGVGRAEAEAVAALLHLLEDASDLVRIYAVEALGYLGDPGVAATLRARLPREWPAVRVWYHYALWRLGEAFAFAEVREVLRRGDGYRARLQAATVLRLAATDETADAFIHALRAAAEQERHPLVLDHLRKLLSELEE